MAVPRAVAPVRPAPRARLNKLAEAAITAVLGAGLAWAAWSLVDLAVAGAIVGGLNGAVSGARRIYRWRSAGGALAFVLDSTWALITTAGGLFVHAVALVQRTPSNYVASLSERCDRHVYVRGVALRRGFLTTIGNVVSGAAGPRRSRVVEEHEHVHVWQARWFGPLYPLLYGAWTLLGALAGFGVWLATGRRDRVGGVVEAWSYYRNPFEWWAYSKEGRWPPPRAVAGHVWRHPIGVSPAGKLDT